MKPQNLPLFLTNRTKKMRKLSYFLKNSNATEDLDAEESAHPEVNTQQNKEATSDHEGPKGLYIQSLEICKIF